MAWPSLDSCAAAAVLQSPHNPHRPSNQRSPVRLYTTALPGCRLHEHDVAIAPPVDTLGHGVDTRTALPSLFLATHGRVPIARRRRRGRAHKHDTHTRPPSPCRDHPSPTARSLGGRPCHDCCRTRPAFALAHLYKPPHEHHPGLASHQHGRSAPAAHTHSLASTLPPAEHRQPLFIAAATLRKPEPCLAGSTTARISVEHLAG